MIFCNPIVLHCENVPQLFYLLILGYFQTLAIADNTVVSIGMCVFFSISIWVSEGIFPAVEPLGHKAGPCLIC